jgi:hypothetical protein
MEQEVCQLFFATFCQISGFKSGKGKKIAGKISFVSTKVHSKVIYISDYAAKWQHH